MSTILIVEDDPVSQKILNNLLVRRGHTIIRAESVADALKKLEGMTVVDLVILDNQLQGDYGWEFVKQVRSDVIFQNLPIIVYTASSDRTSVIKYMQFGVQKILVKPYNNQHLEAEIETAVKFNWKDKLFEPVDITCMRLGNSVDDYYTSISKAAEEILQYVPRLNRLVGLSDSSEFDTILSKIDSLAVNLGLSVVQDACESIIDTLRKGMLDKSVHYINRLVSAARLMQHRALLHFGMETETGNALSALFTPQNSNSGNIPEPEAGHRKRISLKKTTDDLNYILQSPINAFAQDFKLVAKRKLFTAQETLEIILGSKAKTSIGEVRYSVELLSGCDKLDRAQAINCLKNESTVHPRITALLQASGIGANFTLEQQLDKLGIAQTLILWAMNHWLSQCHSERNPIYLEPLMIHSLAVSMASREISRKFSDSHHFAIGGAYYDLGKWLLCLQFPAFYAMALTLGNNDAKELEAAERSIFGLSSAELAAACLRKWKIDETYVQLLLSQEHLEKLPSGHVRVYGSIIALANAITHAHLLGYNGAGSGVGEESFIHSPAWELLKTEKIELPLAPQDYFSVFKPVMEKIKVQISAFMG